MKVILCFRQGRLAFRANNFGLSSVLVGREVILCFRQGRVYPLKFFILEMKVILCSCRQGSYPLFQAGKVSILC